MTSVLRQAAQDARSRRFGHQGAIIWLTGLSGAGKSTLARGADARLFDAGYATTILDGDELRRGISADLGFSPADRHENIRRAGHIAALLADAGLLVFVAMISPFSADRAAVRTAGSSRFLEVFVNASLAACELRDPRNLYRRARAGEILEFTGVSSPYEAPEHPDLVIDTEHVDVEQAVGQLVAFVAARVPLRSAGAERTP